jgi:putative serine/threonine protein kinase
LQVSQIVTLDQLRDKGYGIILCYPRPSTRETAKRIRELKCLGVKALEFIGEKTAFNVPILGKGYVGIVVAARLDNERIALKIRRVDADRLTMEHEAEMLKTANGIGVGPRLIGVTENFLLMEFVKGRLFPEWIEKLSGKGTKNRTRCALQKILELCWRLDQAGLDHGELSRASKHIIMDEDSQPHIVDFETASIQRRVSNVTSMCQYLFIGSQISKIIMHKFGKVSQERLKLSLRDYKRNRTRENFDDILQVCLLDP